MAMSGSGELGVGRRKAESGERGDGGREVLGAGACSVIFMECQSAMAPLCGRALMAMSVSGGAGSWVSGSGETEGGER